MEQEGAGVFELTFEDAGDVRDEIDPGGRAGCDVGVEVVAVEWTSSVTSARTTIRTRSPWVTVNSVGPCTLPSRNVTAMTVRSGSGLGRRGRSPKGGSPCGRRRRGGRAVAEGSGRRSTKSTMTTITEPTITSQRTDDFMRRLPSFRWRLPDNCDGPAPPSCTLPRTSSAGRPRFGHHRRLPEVRAHLRHPRDRADRHLAGGRVARHGPATDDVSAGRGLTGSTGSPIRTRPASTTSAYIPNGSPPRPPIRGRKPRDHVQGLEVLLAALRGERRHDASWDLAVDPDRGVADADEVAVPRVLLVGLAARDSRLIRKRRESRSDRSPRGPRSRTLSDDTSVSGWTSWPSPSRVTRATRTGRAANAESAASKAPSTRCPWTIRPKKSVVTLPPSRSAASSATEPSGRSDAAARFPGRTPGGSASALRGRSRRRARPARRSGRSGGRPGSRRP